MTFRSDTLYSLTQDPNTVQEGFVLFNARLGVRSQAGLDVALWGRNLTDEDYAVAIFSTSVVGGYSHFLAPGRTIGIEVRADF
jgi:outer membrane receptor protein involved in Fe transport